MTDSIDIAAAHAPTLPPGTAVAVTGATGFIGGRLVELLLAEGVAVTCLLRGNQAPRLRHSGARLVTVDVAEAEPLRRALNGIEIVFHCAYAWDDAGWNDRAMTALIEACQANGCRRLVHVSSIVVYQVPPEGEVTETTAEDISASGYAHTKRQLEATLLQAVREQALPATIVQPTIVYGPYSRPWTIDPADSLRYGTVVLPDAGEGVCNAVYVDDVVSAVVLAATHPGAVGQRFLVSGPEPTTWRQFYEAIAAAIGANPPQYRPADAIVRQAGTARRMLRIASDPGQVMRRVARIEPCRKILAACLAALPETSRGLAQNELFGPNTRRRGRVHMPSLGQLEFLRSRATIQSGKARQVLGYAPRYDLASGMVPTALFLGELYRRLDRQAG